MAEKERDVQSLNQVNELVEVTLKEKDQQLEREREAKRLMKIEIDESKEVIKTLKIENTNVTQKHTDIMAKLKENDKIVDKLRTSNEKIIEEINLIQRNVVYRCIISRLGLHLIFSFLR